MDEQELKNALPSPSKLPYLIAFLIMAVLTVAACVIIGVVRPDRDNMQFYVMITGFFTTTTAAVLAFMKSQETHLSVNSRLEQFLKSTEGKARAEGELAGKEAGRKAADERTDTLTPPPSQMK